MLPRSQEILQHNCIPCMNVHVHLGCYGCADVSAFHWQFIDVAFGFLWFLRMSLIMLMKLEIMGSVGDLKKCQGCLDTLPHTFPHRIFIIQISNKNNYLPYTCKYAFIVNSLLTVNIFCGGSHQTERYLHVMMFTCFTCLIEYCNLGFVCPRMDDSPHGGTLLLLSTYVCMSAVG